MIIPHPKQHRFLESSGISFGGNGETILSTYLPVFCPETNRAVVNTKQPGSFFGTIITVEEVKNNLPFKFSRVFFLPIGTQNPYSLDVQLSGLTSNQGGILI